MNVNYAEICRVGKLEAVFQQVPLVHFFLKFSQYCCETSIIQIQQRKLKKYFLRQKNTKKKKKKNTLLKKMHRSDQLLAVNLILG